MTISAAISAILAASTSTVTPTGSQATINGHVRVDPAASILASIHGLQPDEDALARLIGSEVGSLPAQYHYAVGEVTVNEAAARGVSITKLLTGSGPNVGFYGEQSGRWASTARPFNGRHLAAARQVLSGTARGFTRGARKFFDPKVQDGGKQGGKPLAFDALGIARKWFGEGYRWIGTVSDPLTGELLIDPYRLMLMSKTGSATLAETEAAIRDGRQRWAGQSPAPDAGGSRDESEGLPWAAAAAALLLVAFSV